MQYLHKNSYNWILTYKECSFPWLPFLFLLPVSISLGFSFGKLPFHGATQALTFKSAQPILVLWHLQVNKWRCITEYSCLSAHKYWQKCKTRFSVIPIASYVCKVVLMYLSVQVLRLVCFIIFSRGSVPYAQYYIPLWHTNWPKWHCCDKHTLIPVTSNTILKRDN